MTTPRQMADITLAFRDTLQQFLSSSNQAAVNAAPEEQEKNRQVHEILGRVEEAMVMEAHNLQRMQNGVFDNAT